MQRPSEHNESVVIRLRTGGARTAFFALLWWILTDSAESSWLVGAPVVLFATLASVALLPYYPWSLLGLVRFMPFFLWRSLRGGIDVARRALHPRLPISPTLFDHQWRLPPGLPRVFMANAVSLLPGTLSAELDEQHLHVHMLDENAAFSEALTVLEQRVADVFGLELPGRDRNEA